MHCQRTEKIGNVLLRRVTDEKHEPFVRADLTSLDELRRSFENRVNRVLDDEDFRFRSSFLEYHLSPARHNLLKWFPFNPNGTLLEIGAECGVLTGLFCRKLGKVTALEKSYQKAHINAQRHAIYKNLEIVVGSFENLDDKQQVDYITVIGTLNYIKEYSCEENVNSFLSKIYKMLKPNGTLILTAENKLPLAYNGHPLRENNGTVLKPSHYLPRGSTATTFSKKRLTDLLYSKGFASLEWYYTFPDYIMPHKVFSDSINPRDLNRVWPLCPIRGPFNEFADSFLVFARKARSLMPSRCLGFIGANRRRKKVFRINSRICEENQNRVFVKSADNDDAIPFLQKIVQRDKLAREFFRGYAAVITGTLKGSFLFYPYLNQPTLEVLVADEIKRGDAGFGMTFVEDYTGFVQRLPSKKCRPEGFIKEFGIPSYELAKPVRCLLFGPLDCIPRNILVDDESWYIVDHEWTYEFPIPTDFLIYRGIYSLAINLQECIQSHATSERPVALFCGYGRHRTYIPHSWLKLIRSTEIPLERLAHWNWLFQSKVLPSSRQVHLRLKARPKMLQNVKCPSVEMIFSEMWRKIKPNQIYRSLVDFFEKNIGASFTRLRS